MSAASSSMFFLRLKCSHLCSKARKNETATASPMVGVFSSTSSPPEELSLLGVTDIVEGNNHPVFEKVLPLSVSAFNRDDQSRELLFNVYDVNQRDQDKAKEKVICDEELIGQATVSFNTLVQLASTSVPLSISNTSGTSINASINDIIVKGRDDGGRSGERAQQHPSITLPIRYVANADMDTRLVHMGAQLEIQVYRADDTLSSAEQTSPLALSAEALQSMQMKLSRGLMMWVWIEEDRRLDTDNNSDSDNDNRRVLDEPPNTKVLKRQVWVGDYEKQFCYKHKHGVRKDNATADINDHKTDRDHGSHDHGASVDVSIPAIYWGRDAGRALFTDQAGSSINARASEVRMHEEMLCLSLSSLLEIVGVAPETARLDGEKKGSDSHDAIRGSRSDGDDTVSLLFEGGLALHVEAMNDADTLVFMQGMYSVLQSRGAIVTPNTGACSDDYPGSYPSNDREYPSTRATLSGTDHGDGDGENDGNTDDPSGKRKESSCSIPSRSRSKTGRKRNSLWMKTGPNTRTHPRTPSRSRPNTHANSHKSPHSRSMRSRLDSYSYSHYDDMQEEGSLLSIASTSGFSRLNDNSHIYTPSVSVSHASVSRAGYSARRHAAARGCNSKGLGSQHTHGGRAGHGVDHQMTALSLAHEAATALYIQVLWLGNAGMCACAYS